MQQGHFNQGIQAVIQQSNQPCDVDAAVKHLKGKSQIAAVKMIWVTDQCRSQFKGTRLSERGVLVHHCYYAAGHGKSLSDGEGTVVNPFHSMQNCGGS